MVRIRSREEYELATAWVELSIVNDPPMTTPVGVVFSLVVDAIQDYEERMGWMSNPLREPTDAGILGWLEKNATSSNTLLNRWSFQAPHGESVHEAIINAMAGHDEDDGVQYEAVNDPHVE